MLPTAAGRDEAARGMTAAPRRGAWGILARMADAQEVLSVVASAFVILALLALVTAPVLMTRRRDVLQAAGEATTGRAHVLTDSLKTLFIDEIILLEQVRRGDPHSGVHYRIVRALQDTVISELRDVAPRISPVANARVHTVSRLSTRWHPGPDAFALSSIGAISPRQATSAMTRILTDRDSMLIAEQQLDADIRRVSDRRRAQGEIDLTRQRWLSPGVGLLALIATLLVAWSAQRQRRLAQALGHAMVISEERRADLESITESKNRLMRGFSHDVGNPIGAADGYMQLLEDGIFGPIMEEQRTSIGRARRSLQAALHLINDLLEIARLERGQITIKRESTDVRIAAREAAEQYRALAKAKGIKLCIDTSVAVPSIESDPARVRQVLGNLISNAVKYTVTGEVAVRVGHERDPESRGRLSISVTGTGLGIEKDKQRLLFQEFVRLDPTAGPGIGIGLAMSARIVEALGGAITVRSERGKGSTFVLWLPMR
ncbi:MAG: HAMP domain-containing histidine kinase [Polaromonas sp.]|nr:HAMP domain-containing histidine kinase [Gemmatimonadaceae bacterium]